MGPVYDRLIAPELSLYSIRAVATRLSLGLLQRVSDTMSQLFQAGGERAVPHGVDPGLPAAPGPGSSRAPWTAGVSLVLARG